MNIVTIRMTIPSEDLEFGQILHAGPDVRIEFTKVVPLTDTTVPYFWVQTADQSTFEESVRSDDRVASLERVVEGANNCLYKIEWESPLNGFSTILHEHDLVVEEAIGTEPEWQFQLRGPNHDNLSALRETLQENGISSTVTGVWSLKAPKLDRYSLTDKQREAVELAFTEGYFDVPKETNLSELAEQLDISRQSFSRRLDRGVYRTLAESVMAETQVGIRP